MIVWDLDDDSCNQLDCLPLACKQHWFCMAEGVYATCSSLAVALQVGLLKIVSNGL